MLLKTHSFKFGEFLLNPKEKILLRGGEPLSITPKAFQLLSVLVENHGHLVEKEDLIKAVWADSFVEEGNLTFTIRLLRKALGDSSQNPRFIETVPKHGYRFIADVRSITAEEADAPKFFSAAKSAQSSGASAHHFAVEQRENLSAADSQSEPEKKTGAEAIPHLASPPPTLASRSLFGREREITLIEKMLCREDVRLVTLTGIGGSGKTSLARVIAGICSAHFPDGVFFVELAPIFNSDLVVAAIAQTLDVKESGSNSLLETLQTFLRTRQILLVLDNFEQVIAAAPSLKEILAATARLKVLVTSRAALNLSIENELLIPPLAVPSSDFASIPIAELENYPSVRMFVERARAVEPNFVLSGGNAADVAEICVRLNGLPLAIELAAARTKLLKPAAMLRRLENRLQILTSRTMDLPVRQQTMRDTIAWSYDLLGERGKTLFRRLAVFAGGFTIEAAEVICGEDDGGTEVLDELESLVGDNLLQKTDDRDGETCLLMLEIIREYAAERLAENPSEVSAARRRHADFYLNYAKNIEREVMGTRQAERLNQMEAERDNFRAAMDWGRKTGNGEYELRLAAALATLWTLRGYLSEGIERLNEALAGNPSAAPAVRAKALAWLGQLIWVKGDYVTAIAVCENGLMLARQVNYPIIAALSLFVLGMSHWYKYGDAEKSIAYLEESLSLYRELEYDAGIVFTLVVLAAIRHSKSDLPQAERLLKESLAVAKSAGNNLMLSIALVNYGRLEIDKGNLARAKKLCQESLRLRGELADSWGLVQCLEPLAVVALKENDPRRAAKMLGAIDVLLESLGAAPPLIFRADHEPSAAAARAALAAETFAELFAEGRKMSLSEIVSVALDESPNSRLDADFLKTETHFSSVETAASTDDLKELSAPLRLTSDFNSRTRKWSWLTAAFFIVSVIAFVLWYALT